MDFIQDSIWVGALIGLLVSPPVTWYVFGLGRLQKSGGSRLDGDPSMGAERSRRPEQTEVEA